MLIINFIFVETEITMLEIYYYTFLKKAEKHFDRVKRRLSDEKS